GVENLNLVEPVQENSAVAAVLVLAVRRVGGGPLDVQLAIAIGVLSPDVPTVGHRCEITLSHGPLRRSAFDLFPIRQILAVEKHNGIRGWTPRLRLGAFRPRSDDRR